MASESSRKVRSELNLSRANRWLPHMRKRPLLLAFSLSRSRLKLGARCSPLKELLKGYHLRPNHDDSIQSLGRNSLVRLDHLKTDSAANKIISKHSQTDQLLSHRSKWSAPA